MINFNLIASKVSSLAGKGTRGSMQLVQESLDLMSELYEEVAEEVTQTLPNMTEFFQTVDIPTLEDLLHKYSFEQMRNGSMTRYKKFIKSLVQDAILLAEKVDESLSTQNPLLDLITKISFAIAATTAAAKLIGLLLVLAIVTAHLVYVIATWLLFLGAIAISVTISLIGSSYGTIAVIEFIEKTKPFYERIDTTSSIESFNMNQ